MTFPIKRSENYATTQSQTRAVVATRLNKSLLAPVGVTAPGKGRDSRSSLKRNEGCGNWTTCWARSRDGKHGNKWNVHPVTINLSNKTCFMNERFGRVKKNTQIHGAGITLFSHLTPSCSGSPELFPCNCVVTTNTYINTTAGALHQQQNYET
jgi:hypothetical protein